MKKIISVFVIAAVSCTALLAQEKKELKKANDSQWIEKMKAERVAHITSELDLSEAEAQKFWPVYNDVQNKRREAYGKSFQAMRELREAVDKGEDSKAKLDAYLKAKKAASDVDEEAPKKFRKVLPEKKVAKLILSEESFRQQQIGKLGGPRPGGPRSDKRSQDAK